MDLMSETSQIPVSGRWKRYPSYKQSGVEWLGEVPEGWGKSRLRFLCSITTGSKNTEDSDPSGQYPFFVRSNTIERLPTFSFDEEAILTAGDGVGVAKVFHYFNGKFDVHQRVYVLTRFKNILGNFLFYYFRENLADDVLKLSAKSTVDSLRLPMLQNFPVLIPSFSEQTAIVTFLDCETARIDALIEKKERLITLLEEKRAALISHAVTKGLDPDAKMKDSGVEWIGMVPDEWKILQLRRLIRKFVDYRGKTPEKVESGRLLITARNIKKGQIDFSLSEEFMKEEDYDAWMVRGFPEKGDVLITTEAPLGEIAQITDTEIALAQRIILLKADKTLIFNEFLKYLLIADSGKGELWSRATGSTAIGIKAEHLRSVLAIVPQINEQREIIQYIKTEVTKLENPVNKILNSITILQEYRSALISAAVTGKIDVRREAVV